MWIVNLMMIMTVSRLVYARKKLHTPGTEHSRCNSTMTPLYWTQATQELAARDTVMRQLIRQFEGGILTSHGCAFTTLARSIVGQQISVKAAESVWQKVICTIPDMTPHTIAAAGQDLLRTCGLSAKKITYLQDLSRHFTQEALNETAWEDMNDEAIIVQLTQVKGIGRWTAEMFLIFHLQRPDVLPLDDIGLQRAISQHYYDKQPVDKKTMRELAKPWQPWRSVATWYLWRSLDPLPVAY
jgi:DNA-3-methyladenine glycosylase II